MALTIVATAGSASANSFATVTAADDYLEGRLNASAWTGAASVDLKAQALVEATRDLDLLPWGGTRTDSTQALSWPRQYALDPDAPDPVDPSDNLTWPVYFDDDEIPGRIQKATIELALQYLKAGTTDLAVTDTKLAVKRKKVDVLETEYVEPYQRPQGLARYPRILALIRPLLDPSRAHSRQVVRS